MTEKRFKVIETITYDDRRVYELTKNDIGYYNFKGEKLLAHMICNELNILLEENEQLKNKIDILEDDNENIFIDLNSIGGGKTSDSYAKRCRDYCVHYDEVVANCYLGNNIFEHCEEYEPKYTGKLENSLR